MKDLTKGSISRCILAFALPIFFSNILQLCYSLTDTRIVGSFLGESALASVGATSVLSNLNVGFWLSMANGLGVYTARYFGAKQMNEVRRSFAAALVLGLGTTLVISALELIFIGPILSFLNVPDSLRSLATTYIVIIILGSLFLTLYDICTATMRAIGDSFTPLVILVISVVINIIGDVVFLVILRTGVWGAACATVFSQFLAAVVCWFYMMKKYEILHLSTEDFKTLDLPMIKGMYALGLSMAFMNSMVNFGSLTLQTSINRLGDQIIVAHTAARKATEIFMIMFSVFGQTMATYCGQNYGAGDYDRIRKGLRVTLLYTFAWCGLVLIMSFTLSPTIVHLITGTDDPVIIKAASNYLKFDSVFYAVPAVICIVRNALQGLNEKIVPLVSSALEMVGKMIIAVTLVPMLGYWGVIVTEPIVWFIMVIPLILKIVKVLPRHM